MGSGSRSSTSRHAAVAAAATTRPMASRRSIPRRWERTSDARGSGGELLRGDVREARPRVRRRARGHQERALDARGGERSRERTRRGRRSPSTSGAGCRSTARDGGRRTIATTAPRSPSSRTRSARHGETIAHDLARAYRIAWPTEPFPVDVTRYANWAGAYSTMNPTTHVVVSSVDARNAGAIGLETLFHEASHVLVRPVRNALAAELNAQRKSADSLWHALLFFTTGDAVEATRAGTRAVRVSVRALRQGRLEHLTVRSSSSGWQPWLDGTGHVRRGDPRRDFCLVTAPGVHPGAGEGQSWGMASRGRWFVGAFASVAVAADSGWLPRSRARTRRRAAGRRASTRR